MVAQDRRLSPTKNITKGRGRLESWSLQCLKECDTIEIYQAAATPTQEAEFGGVGLRLSISIWQV